MFSISAINDTDSKNQWQPLAPTKEAQEFHLSQMYHDGLLKLQAKDYEKARNLLEAVLKDPLVSNAQVENSAKDGHLLQLRFLGLKNLATVFLQEGPTNHESALRCYLQAVEIDSNDYVVWNQLGTLSCSMGSLGISRWAFEQGLVCSPNNWNCMEKLMEVLIAIGDEMACLSVANLILRQWPSHHRALHVKNTIEEPEPIPFAPKGIDKLEPEHVLLKFGEKRKAPNEGIDKAMESKRLKESIELQLPEASWTALASELQEILCPSVATGSEPRTGGYRSGHVRISIQLNLSLGNVRSSVERKEPICMTAGTSIAVSNCNSGNDSTIYKEGAIFEEQPLERRSSRLRSRKPGKEVSDFASNKDLVKVVKQFLEPYLVGSAGPKEFNHDDHPFSVNCAEGVSSSLDKQCTDVIRFIERTSENFGAYHMSHLLLEEITNIGISYQVSNSKILDLEKLTRHCGLDRTPECCLFLSELYYDFGIRSLDSSAMSEFMSEASYHLCKILEFVSLEYPFHIMGMQGNENCFLEENSERNHRLAIDSTSSLRNNYPFWVRYSWLRAHLFLLDGEKEKARRHLSFALSLLADKKKMNNSLGSICLPHCKAIKRLTTDRVLHEMNLIEADYLLKTTVTEMLEKHMYTECVNLLTPLLLSANDVHVDVLYAFNQECKGFKSVELSALDALIKACEQEESMNVSIYLDCHRRTLQILVAGAGVEGITPNETPVSNASSTESTESLCKHWNHLVAEEVKAISQSASRIKSTISPIENSNCIPMTIVGDIQSLLLALMCSIAGTYFSKMTSGSGPGFPHSIEQTEICSFVDAAIAFCKLQHLDFSVPIKTQTELIGAIHDMLAEFGICCAHGIGEEEGTFLKFAIKHLLALDMKLKSNFQTLSKEHETNSAEHCSPENQLKKSELLSDGIHINGSQNRSHFNTAEVQTDDKAEASDSGKDVGRLSSEGLYCHTAVDNGKMKAETDNNAGDGLGVLFQEREIQNKQIVESGDDSMENEDEELELGIDTALNQCFYCLYGLNLRSDSSYEEDLAMHKNTSRGDYQTKEQCADVFQYILPYAKASSFLDDPDLSEDKLLVEAQGFLDSIKKASSIERSEPYLEVYSNLFYLLAQSEEMSATDKWAGFVLTKEGEEFVEQNANLFKYDLLYNPSRLESWQRLANIYDEEVDLLLNDGSKQINVLGWRKDATLAQRVEASRRRSKRCLFMTLALAMSVSQQGEIHELLALVYYDGIQNVVPFYDQRFSVPSKDATWKIYCQNSMRHFKRAFKHKGEWSHAFYIGKLSEKLGYSHDVSFSYYAKAIALNQSAVDPFYRMHASRMKLLCTCGKQNEEALKVVTAYSFAHSTKENVMNIWSSLGHETSESSMIDEDNNSETADFHKFEAAWQLLYSDCLSALETCVEGELKHFHKARYMLAQGLYRRGRTGDLDKAKEELSFCFKSSRSSFTINMWEIDSMVKRGRRKTLGPSGNRRTLEVNLAESSRKYITCIRKYILFYLKLLEETGEISTLDRAYISLRADKRFSLCLEDLVPVALGRYIRALIFSVRQYGIDLDNANDVEHLLEKLFSLLLEQINMWPEICGLPELLSPELTESNLCGYLYQYIQWLERNIKVEMLEGINEKIRKRLKNPKLSNSNCTIVYRHVSAAWCRSLVISMALLTPLHLRLSSDIQVQNLLGGGFENEQLLCVDLQSEELWNSAFEDLTHLKMLESKWNPSLSRIKNVIVKKVSDEDLETAFSLLRSSYNFYKDTSCALLPSGINLYMVPSQLATETYIQPGIDGVDLLDMNTSRKLLLWAYTLLHGHCTSVSLVIKYCEENLKSKMKRGTGISSTPSSASVAPDSASHPGGGKDGTGKASESEVPKSPAVDLTSLPECAGHKVASLTLPETDYKPNWASAETEGKGHAPETECGCSSVSSGQLPLHGITNWANGASDAKDKASATPCLLPCNNPVAELSSVDLQNDTDPKEV
ncbi:uncharacterized protein LOC111368655 isoform X3 [Olea europaea var. sylvestris]|uniref:uncharacterized protein LOC111368655 isoform X3 n=1 Tax=Olea europaea var. sylvestris TaxID=158386 RepID=UPI000C1D8595|nr:uncharacterized protein LOC111368655 isoform X3 [Olea europaea var. sylvestris]